MITSCLFHSIYRPKPIWTNLTAAGAQTALVLWCSHTVLNLITALYDCFFFFFFFVFFWFLFLFCLFVFFLFFFFVFCFLLLLFFFVFLLFFYYLFIDLFIVISKLLIKLVVKYPTKNKDTLLRKVSGGFIWSVFYDAYAIFFLFFFFFFFFVCFFFQ